MVKYIISCLMFLSGCLSCLGMTDYDFTVDNIFYKIVEDGVYVTYGEYDIIPWAYRPSEIVPMPDNYKGEVIIPASVTYDGVDYAVTGIGERAFYDCPNLTSVQIPNSVTRIGNEAFYNCDKLQSIRIPDSVDTMGEYAFKACDNMEAFYGKFASEDNRLLVIDGEIMHFAGHGLESYCIPDNIRTIGYFAFESCGLVSVEIPNSVVAIKNHAFTRCSKLTSVQIPESVVEIGYGTFWDCFSLEEIALSDNLRSIEGFCFKDCRRLQSVVLPKSLNKICFSAFEGCQSLSKIESHVRVPMDVELGGDVFDSEIYTKCQLSVPWGSSDLYKRAPVWKNFAKIVELPLSDDYIPLLEEGKEWGHVKYSRDLSTVRTGSFARLACDGKEVIDGTEYVRICEYSSYLKPDDAPVIAYMREDEGKVYVRYAGSLSENEYNYYMSDFIEVEGGIPDFSEEHLLYDFNMKEGDVIELDLGFGYYEESEYSRECGKLTLKCVGTGTIAVDGVQRRFLKFDKKVNISTNAWMQYEYLVEGVGPVGNCNFTMPYRSEPKTSMISNIEEIRMLYQREAAPSGEIERVLQGRLLYRSGYFDVFAVCDPSVYYWESVVNDDDLPSFDHHSASDLMIRLREENGKYTVVCRENPLNTVKVYNVIGRLLYSYTTNEHEFVIDPENYGGTVLVRAATENESRTFILNKKGF